jgi:L-threonylcarbamoyladenylate synthase
MKTRLLTAATENIAEAAAVIKKGGLVVYPTDTVYGLGCDPFNGTAVESLLRVKGERDKPLPILAYSMDDVERVAELPERARKFGERHWPGPLTLVLLRKNLPEVVTLSSTTVGVRIPNNAIALMLLKLSGGLLVGTSANKSGEPPPCTALEAYERLEDEVDVVLDGGPSELKASSTVLDLTSHTPRILRAGALSLKEL